VMKDVFMACVVACCVCGCVLCVCVCVCVCAGGGVFLSHHIHTYI